FAGKKSAQIREILISESAWEEMTCLFAPSLAFAALAFASFGLFVCYKFVTQEITYSKIHTMIIVIVTGLLAFTLIKLRR
ncbi:hypothetical protein GV743_25410, partial [Klebsiella pneumoniae]|nr:hypothetical protein [Klebsiella pneumoniae]